MNMENVLDNKYGELSSLAVENFVIHYLPYQSFLNDCLEYTSNDLKIFKDYHLHLMDLNKYTSFLSINEKYNKIYLEILFMYMANVDDLKEEEYINGIIEEFHSGVFEAYINIDIFNKNLHLINKDLIIRLLIMLNKDLIKKDNDLIILGWLKSSLIPNTIGVLYV